MRNIPDKYTIKIPSDVTILYCDKKKIITVIGPLAKKSLKTKVKIKVLELEKVIKISSITFTKTSNNERKKVKATQGTTTALIKQLLVETSAILYQKLKFVGVGYRVFNVENYENRLLLLKLGYSHPIYFKISDKLKVFSLKFTNLFLSSNSYKDITQIASEIRMFKKPEPYKGKGILNANEKIILKEGKKV